MKMNFSFSFKVWWRILMQLTYSPQIPSPDRLKFTCYSAHPVKWTVDIVKCYFLPPLSLRCREILSAACQGSEELKLYCTSWVFFTFICHLKHIRVVQMKPICMCGPSRNCWRGTDFDWMMPRVWQWFQQHPREFLQRGSMADVSVGYLP
jgi:hypothetical protein